MKKKSLLIACAITALAITACGSKADKEDKTTKNTETVVTTQKTETEATTEEVTEVESTEAETEATTEESTEETTKKHRKQNETKKETESVYVEPETTTAPAPSMAATVENASGFVGKTLAELTATIGDYSSFETAGACFEDENELNGMAYYDGFTVYCHSENGQTKWVIDAVE